VATPLESCILAVVLAFAKVLELKVSVTESLESETVFPFESSSAATTFDIVSPAVVLAGWVVKTILFAAPALIVIPAVVMLV